MQLYEPEKKNLAISLSALGLSTAITMTVPFGMGKIIDVVTQPGGLEMLPSVSAALGGLFLVGAATNVVRNQHDEHDWRAYLQQAASRTRTRRFCAKT